MHARTPALDPTLDITDPDRPTLLDQIKSYGGTAIRSLLFLDGLCVITLYFTPAQICAQTPSCGKPISDLIGYGAAVALFALGGLNYAALNGYFSLETGRKLADSLAKQKTLAEKAGKCLVIVTYAASQEIQTVVGVMGSKLEKMLTIMGAFPGYIYGSACLIEKDIPSLYSDCKISLKRLYWYLKDWWSPLSPEEQYRREKNTFDYQQKTRFEEILWAKRNYVRAHAKEIHPENMENPVEALMMMPSLPETLVEKIAHHIGVTLGAFMGLNISVGWALNSFRFMATHLPLALAILATIHVNSSFVYGNLDVSIAGLGCMADILIDIIRGGPVRSIFFQLHPLKSIVFGLLAALLAPFSYAVGDAIYQQELPYPDNLPRNIFRISGNTGIGLYHFCGLIGLGILLDALCSSAPEKNLNAMYECPEDFRKMTLDAFNKWVEENPPELNERLGLQTFAQHKQRQAEEIASVTANQLVIDLGPEAAPPEKESYVQQWMSWFSRAKEDKGTELERRFFPAC